MAGVDILASAMTGANAAFLADLYARWVERPDSVDPSFDELFSALNDDARAVLTDASGASWAPRPRGGFAPAPERAAGAGKGKARRRRRRRRADPEAIRRAQLDSLRALMLIRSYRVRGHLQAQLDPLGLQQTKPHEELDPATYGFTEADWDRPIFINGVLGLETATMREIMAVVRATYCGPIGVEFMHIQDAGPEGLDPGADGGRALGRRLRRDGQARHPGAVDRGRGLRVLLREAIRLHQALRPGGRREHHPGGADGDRDLRAATGWRRSPSAWRTAAGSTCW